ncbi:putative methyltransferase-like protein 24 [Tubulanus polymorphus]|uniref:putative methyltransferase-like protein 24 n=1 Tax=Tubulanus polymorphus TaxID=672921 RepID=UPI003DA5108A
MYTCKNRKIYGEGGEGSWYVCHDEPFAPKPGCLALSFGIANLWQFDDQMEKFGCEVYAFDPSMNKPDHRHSKKVWFYDLGVGGSDTDSFIPRKDEYVESDQVWKVRTVRSILKMVKRENRIIDFFKIDIEGTEFDVLHNILSDGTINIVKQYLVEYHVFGEKRFSMGQYAADMKKTLEIGFRPFYVLNKIFNTNSDNYRWQADMGFINTKFFPHSKNSNVSSTSTY